MAEITEKTVELINSALTAARSYRNIFSKAEALADVVRRYVKIKDLNSARKIAEEIDGSYSESGYWRTVAFVTIAEVSKEEKDLASARKSAQGISNSYWRSRAFGAIGGLSGEEEDFNSARKAAEGIKDSYLRNKAFAHINLAYDTVYNR